MNRFLQNSKKKKKNKDNRIYVTPFSKFICKNNKLKSDRFSNNPLIAV